MFLSLAKTAPEEGWGCETVCAYLAVLYLRRKGDMSVSFIPQACSSFVEPREGVPMKACELMNHLQTLQVSIYMLVHHADNEGKRSGGVTDLLRDMFRFRDQLQKYIGRLCCSCLCASQAAFGSPRHL